MADKPIAAVMPSNADIKSVTYEITKKGRKWFEGIVPEKGYKAQIAICPASAAFEVGGVYTFDAGVVFESNKYGANVKVFPLDEQRMALVSQEKEAQKTIKEIKRWLGYVEDKAPEGYIYSRGVAELTHLGITNHPELNERLQAAIRLATLQGHRNAIRQNLGYIRDNFKSYWYVRGADKVNAAIKALQGMGEDTSRVEAELADLHQRFVEAEKKAKEIAAEKRRKEETGGYDGPVFRLSGGSGYGYHGWSQGQVVHNAKRRIEAGEPEYLFILSARETYYREDGMSFGVGDEDGYVYSATAREATLEESAPLREREARTAEIRQAWDGLRQVADLISKTGERPTGTNIVEGEELDLSSPGVRIYGGGEWFVIGQEFIWYIVNNGMNGDNWACNNVRTIGAGAIGCRLPFDADLAAKIRSLFAVAGNTKKND